MSYANPSAKEVEAIQAPQVALKALLSAGELCEKAGYGSMVVGPLADAQREENHALETPLGRN